MNSPGQYTDIYLLTKTDMLKFRIKEQRIQMELGIIKETLSGKTALERICQLTDNFDESLKMEPEFIEEIKPNRTPTMKSWKGSVFDRP